MSKKDIRKVTRYNLQRSTRPGNLKATASERAVRRITDLGDLRKLVVAAGGGSWLEGDATTLLIR